MCTNDGKEEKLQSFFGWDFPIIQNTDGTTVIVLRTYMHCSFVLCVRAVIFGQRLSFIDVLPVFCFVRVYTHTHSLFLSNKYPLISFFLAVHRGVSICFVIHCIYGSEESSKEKLRLISSYSYSVCV